VTVPSAKAWSSADEPLLSFPSTRSTFDCVIGPFSVPSGRGTSPGRGFATIVDESPPLPEAKAFVCRRNTEAVLTKPTIATLPTRYLAAFIRFKTSNRAIFIVVRPAFSARYLTGVCRRRPNSN
jgi:hypothetical protein